MPAVKTISQDVVYAFVRQHYLPKQDLREMEQMADGWQSAVWRFKTPNGQYLLKIYEFDIRTAAEIEDELAFYAFLNQHDVRVPLIYRSLKQHLLTPIQAGEQTTYAVLMKWEALSLWQPETITASAWAKIGLTLGRLHEISLLYPQPGQDTKPTEADLAQKNHATVLQAGFFGAIAASPLASSLTAGELAHIGQLSTSITELINTYPIAAELHYSLIHADLQVDHVRFLPDGTVYIFDFEGKRWGAVANDLGRFLTALYGESTIDFARWEELKGQLITAYTQVSPLAAVDIWHIDLFALRYLHMMLYYFSRGATETNMHLIRPTVQRFLQLGGYLLNQLSRNHSNREK